MQQHIGGGRVEPQFQRGIGGNLVRVKIVAKILQQHEALSGILGQDLWRRKPDGVQMPRDFREIGNGIDPSRRSIHQHGGRVLQPQPFVAARRGIAGKQSVRGLGPTGMCQKITRGIGAVLLLQVLQHGRGQIGPAVKGQGRPAALASRFKGNADRIGGQDGPKTIGPLDQADGRSERVFEAKLDHLVGVGQAVKVGVPDLRIGRVGLHQGVGRRGHVFGFAQPGADESAGKVGFAGADRTVQQNAVARLQHG